MTKEISKLTIELDGIGHAISDNNLTVPPFQRSYAWGKNHVNDLYDDLLTAIRDSEEEYFIGSIVLSVGTDRDEVIDGQQRLATISFLMAAIRDYFDKLGDKERAESIQNRYLSGKDRRTLEVLPKLKLNSLDHDYFCKKIIETTTTKIDPTTASHLRIEDAIDVAQKKITAYVSTINNPIDSLLDLCDFIDNHLKIILVKVPDHANAFTIFETLNDRGLTLAISDLLKNYLLGQADNRIDEVQASWARVCSLMENIENEDLVVTFLRQFWSSRYGLTRERDLYKKIKEKITAKQKVIDFLNELEKGARIYAGLIDTSSSFWSDYSGVAKEHMSTLNLFRMVQMRPLLLSVINKFSKIEVEKTMGSLVSISVRLLICGGLGGGVLEAQFSERAKEINDGEIQDTENLIMKLSKVIPNDIKFKESFKTATVSQQYLARYYLMTLEKMANGEENPELIPNTDTTVVNLEHVLPKNQDGSWEFDSETQAALVKRLGNLAIMKTKSNSNMGNGSFLDKKPHYAESTFELTKMIADYDKWTSDTINERQNKLAELAVKTWKI